MASIRIQIIEQFDGKFGLMSWSRADDNPGALEVFSAPAPNLTKAQVLTAAAALLTGMPGTMKSVNVQGISG